MLCGLAHNMLMLASYQLGPCHTAGALDMHVLCPCAVYDFCIREVCKLQKRSCNVTVLILAQFLLARSHPVQIDTVFYVFTLCAFFSHSV